MLLLKQAGLLPGRTGTAGRSGAAREGRTASQSGEVSLSSACLPARYTDSLAVLYVRVHCESEWSALKKLNERRLICLGGEGREGAPEEEEEADREREGREVEDVKRYDPLRRRHIEEPPPARACARTHNATDSRAT